jgi:hypothetical protein
MPKISENSLYGHISESIRQTLGHDELKMIYNFYSLFHFQKKPKGKKDFIENKKDLSVERHRISNSVQKFKRDIKIINLQTDLATPDGPFKERKTKEKKLF